MQSSARLMLAGGLLSLALTCAIDPTAAFAYTVLNPLVHGNLAVYPVEGHGPGGPSLITLDQAVRQGAVKIHEMDNAQIEIENLSGQGIFLPAGTLLHGGLQDQVVTTTTIVPPRSGRVTIGTYCVDPYRSTARSGEDPKLFTSTGALFPWTAARLGLATPVPWSKPVSALRQTAVWWSIDTLRSRLEQRLGEAVEPPHIPTWTRDESLESRALVQLAARRSSWTTSLPLALQNRRLAEAVKPYVDGMRRLSRRGNVIGAVFAINGKFYAADLYGSHALFRAVWPALARAYATEAIALGGETMQPLPSAADAKAFLEAALKDADARASNAAPESAASRVAAYDGETALASETIAGDGRWVYRSVLAKLDPAAATQTPDALAVRILATNRVNDLALAQLTGDETIVLRRGADDQWTAEVPAHVAGGLPMAGVDWAAALLAAPPSTRSARGLSPAALVPAVFAALLLLAAAALMRRRPRRPAVVPAAAAPAAAPRTPELVAVHPPAVPAFLRARDSTRRLREFRRSRFAARATAMAPAHAEREPPELPLAA
jgi:hypothetical protein